MTCAPTGPIASFFTFLFANLGIDCLEKNRLRPLDRFAQRSAGTLVFVARLRQRLCAKKYHSLSSEVVVRIQSTIFYLGETSLERGAMVDSDGLGVGAAAFTQRRAR